MDKKKLWENVGIVSTGILAMFVLVVFGVAIAMMCYVVYLYPLQILLGAVIGIPVAWKLGKYVDDWMKSPTMSWDKEDDDDNLPDSTKKVIKKIEQAQTWSDIQ